MNLDSESDAKKFYLLWRGWNSFNTNFSKGYSTKSALAKCMDGSLNPRPSTVDFVSELIDLGIIVFEKDGRLAFDEDKLEEYIKSNPTYSVIVAFFKRDKITI